MEISSELIQFAQDTILRPNLAGALFIFWFSLVNELVAVLPYVTVLSGQLIFLGEGLSFSIISKLFIFIALPAGVGGAIGSLLVYGAAYFGGKLIVERFGKYLRLSWSDIEKVNRWFKGAWYDEFIFFAIRIIPVLPSLPVTAAAGILRMRPSLYFLLTAIAFTVRMMIMFFFIGIGAEALSY